MNLVLNLIWLIFGGIWLALGYVLAGVVACIFIITIPAGVASFRMASYALWPFGRVVVDRPGGSAGVNVFMNVIWFVIAGVWLAIGHITTAIAQAIARRNPREYTAAHKANAANPMPTAMVSITIHPKLTPKTRKTSDNSHTTSPPTPNPARPTSSSRNSTWIVHRGSPRRVDGRMTASNALNAVSANRVGGNQPLSR